MGAWLSAGILAMRPGRQPVIRPIPATRHCVQCDDCTHRRLGFMPTDILEQFSDALADRLAAAAALVVAIRTGRRDYSGILWRDDVVVTYEQILPQGTEFAVIHRGEELPAKLAGRDPGTNVAVLRLPRGLGATLPAGEPSLRAGS